MSREELRQGVRAALASIVDPRSGRDIVAAGMVADVEVDDAGNVRVAFVLKPDDPPQLPREARRAVQAVSGVTSAKVDVRAAAGDAPATTPKAVPAPTPRPFPHLGTVLAISSGKGGVGKSTVSVNLAAALAAQGHKVGLMDADIYGPNLPRMLGVIGREPVISPARRILPLEAHGLKVMSVGSLIARDVATIWRGPIITKIITQFLGDVDWGQLDYFLVDLPPGTGDAQLSLVQSVNVAAGVIVTTPQEVAVGDALRGAKMFEKVGVPLLGIVENMSWFQCAHCGERTHIFASGGGRRLAEELDVPLLGEIPLQEAVQELAEQGQPVVLAAPQSPAGQALLAMADRVVSALQARG
jgi:ATP-binding protein involved in chromosome partitioning